MSTPMDVVLQEMGLPKIGTEVMVALTAGRDRSGILVSASGYLSELKTLTLEEGLNCREVLNWANVVAVISYDRGGV